MSFVTLVLQLATRSETLAAFPSLQMLANFSFCHMKILPEGKGVERVQPFCPQLVPDLIKR